MTGHEIPDSLDSACRGRSPQLQQPTAPHAAPPRTVLHAHVSLSTTFRCRPSPSLSLWDRAAWLPFPGESRRLPAAWSERAGLAGSRSENGLRWLPVTGRRVGVAGCGAADPREGGATFVLSPGPTPNWTSARSCGGAFCVVASRPSPAPRDSCHWGPAGVSRETWVSSQLAPLIGSLWPWAGYVLSWLLYLEDESRIHRDYELLWGWNWLLSVLYTVACPVTEQEQCRYSVPTCVVLGHKTF